MTKSPTRRLRAGGGCAVYRGETERAGLSHGQGLLPVRDRRADAARARDQRALRPAAQFDLHLQLSGNQCSQIYNLSSLSDLHISLYFTDDYTSILELTL